MMTQAFYTGLSGLKNSGTAIDVVSDNIANASTYGFRSNEVEFASLYGDMIGTGSSNTVNSNVSMGVRVQGTSMNTEAGSLLLTDKSTDMAIYGDGWFGVQDANSNIAYTRAGDFKFDINSDLVTSDGYHVMGTLGTNIKDNILQNTIDILGLADVNKQVPLSFPQDLTYPPKATTIAHFMGNLGEGNSESPIVMTTSVVDSQDNRNSLQLSFSKSTIQPESGSLWDVNATIYSQDGLLTYNTQDGTISFDENGALTSTTITNIDNNGALVDIDLGTGYAGIVAINGSELTASTSSDGTIGGELVGYEINKNAEVIATFTNGAQSSVGKVAVYHFQNDQGLERAGNSKYLANSNSGDPIFYKDANGNNVIGTDLRNYQLETANTKMEVALTELIIFQRSYDANSKIVTTANEMMQKALEMDA